MKFFHETAVIDEGSKIGANTKIWHFSHVGTGAIIGENCTLGQNVFISSKAKIGNNVKIQNNVSVYDKVEIEDFVFCGPSMVFTNVYNPRSNINRKLEYKSTLIKKGATLGANCTILCGLEIGMYSFVGAGSVVTKKVKDFALVIGNPSTHIGWMSRFGERIDLPLSGKGSFKCQKTEDVYHLDGSSIKLEI